MAFTNYDTKEINCKVLYYGPPKAGITTNFRAVFKGTSQELQAGLFEMSPAEDQSSQFFFEFLPVSIGHVGGFHFKLHLYSLPVEGLFDTVEKVVLKGLDGVVFVADSRFTSLGENVTAWESLHRTLRRENIVLSDLPRVIQYNKRDLPDIVPVEILKREFNAQGLPDFEAVATESKGTIETVHAMSKLIIQKMAVP